MCQSAVNPFWHSVRELSRSSLGLINPPAIKWQVMQFTLWTSIRLLLKSIYLKIKFKSERKELISFGAGRANRRARVSEAMLENSSDAGN